MRSRDNTNATTNYIVMVKREHYSTGDIQSDIVGEFFENVTKTIADPVKTCRIEVQHFTNSDNRTSILWYKNKVKAFVIEVRNDFNNIEIIKGSIDD